MLDVDINFLAVTLSGLFAFMLGVAWYHPKVMGARWMELRGLTQKDVETKSYLPFAATFFLWMLSACFYAFLAAFLSINTPAGYFCLSCMLWVAFAMPPNLMAGLYNGSPFEAVAIDTSYQLGGYYIFALVHMSFLYISP